MKKENYLLLIWNQGGVTEVQGLYPDNFQTFEYIRSVLIKDVEEWAGGDDFRLPENLEDESCVYDWYREQTEDSVEYWQVFKLSPKDAPSI